VHVHVHVCVHVCVCVCITCKSEGCDEQLYGEKARAHEVED